MNYYDMLDIKKGDHLNVQQGSQWITGEVVGHQTGSEPSIWLEYTPGFSLRIYTGANFTEMAWYKARKHTTFKFLDSEREMVSLDNLPFGGVHRDRQAAYTSAL